MKILVTPTSFPKTPEFEAYRMLEGFADEIVFNPYGRPLKGGDFKGIFDGVDGFIAGLDYITAEIIESMPKTLKVISRYGAGVDRVDLKAAAQKGIVVTNTPGTNSVAVAELAFGLMLSLARSIPLLDKETKNGEWSRHTGIELCGKTLGILGLGAIGKNIASRAKAFGMRVLAYDPYINTEYARSNGIVACALEDVLKTADFISLHLPLNEETKHIIDKKALSTVKHGVFIINTARGGLIDENAAKEALESGKLGGLGLDVFEAEPVTDSPLLAFGNVVATPHTGAHTAESVQNMGIMAVQNLVDILRGRECKNVVL